MTALDLLLGHILPYVGKILCLVRRSVVEDALEILNVVPILIVTVKEYRVCGHRVRALCAAKGKVAVVGARKRGVKGEDDGLAVCALDDSGNDVALIKASVLEGGILLVELVIVYVLLKSVSRGSHRHKRNKAIAAVYVEKASDGAKLVGGIVLAVSLRVVAQAVVAIDVAIGYLATQVVAVHTRCVNDPAKLARAGKSGAEQLVLVVAAVLHKHKGGTGLLLCLYKLVKLVDRVGAAYLAGNRNTGAHSCHGYL